MTAITAPLALKAFKPLQESGKLETLKRSIQKLNEIMTYAVHREIIPYNPTANIKKEFDSPTVEHFKTIKPEELSDFLFALNTAQSKLRQRRTAGNALQDFAGVGRFCRRKRTADYPAVSFESGITSG